MPRSGEGGDGDGEFRQSVECPHCESVDTELQAPFGTIQANSAYYCNDCGSVFEWVKLEREYD